MRQTTRKCLPGTIAAAVSILLVLVSCGCATRGVRPQTAVPVTEKPPIQPADTKFAEALASFAMGLIADIQDDPGGVLTNCLKLINLDPNNNQAYLRAALAYLELKQPENAVSILEKFRRRSPRKPLPHIYLGIVYEASNQPEKAMQAYEAAVRLGSDDPVPYQRLASAYAKKKQFGRAAEVLNQGVKRVRNTEPLLRNLAEIYLYQAHQTTAETDRQEALQAAKPVLQKLASLADRGDTSPLWALAGLYAELRQYDKVVATLRRVASLIKDPSISAASVGRWISQREDWEAIVAAVEQDLAKKPADSQPLAWLGRVYFDRGMIDRAREYFERIVASTNANELGYIELARILLYKNDPEAAAVLQAGLERYPENVELHNIMAYYLFSQKKFAESLPHYQFVAEHGQDQSPDRNAAFHLNYALAAIHTGNTNLAARELLKGIEINPAALNSFSEYLAAQPPEVIRQSIPVILAASRESALQASLIFVAAFLQIQLRQYEEAYQNFKQALPALTSKRGLETLEQAGVLDDLYFYYGMVAERTGRYQEAVELFEQCIKLNPEAAEALNYVAYMWAERGTNLVKAQQYVERALSKDPDNPAYIDTLGWVYYMRGDYTNALREIERAHKLMPEDPIIAEHLGDVLAALGRKPEAVTYWMSALKINPTNDSLRQKLQRMGVAFESSVATPPTSDPATAEGDAPAVKGETPAAAEPPPPPTTPFTNSSSSAVHPADP